MDDWTWSDWGLAGDWKELLEGSAPVNDNDALRYATYNGVPLGNKDFVDRLEADCGRRLRRAVTGPSAKGRAEAAGAAR